MKNSTFKGLFHLKKKILTIIIISTLVLNQMIIAQSQEVAQDETIAIFGTVVYIDLEGGFYGILSTQGDKYDPINLPIEFQHDGLPVYVVAKIRTDLGSIHMWGIIIEILEIYGSPSDPNPREIGDVNDDGNIDIVDALIIAQYYVGMSPSLFDPRYADVDVNGEIDIVDALILARFTVGLISQLPCQSMPIIEGNWSLRHYNWQDNLVGEEYVTIERIGNEITIYSDTNDELLGTGKIIKNNLAPPYNDRSEYLIQGIDFRGLGIDKIFIDDESHMETELPLAESSNPSVFSRIVTILGEYQLIPNPPTTDPALPGMVYGLIAEKNYILTNKGSWFWSEDQPNWPGYAPDLEEMVEVVGYSSIKSDITGALYYEFEVLQIKLISSLRILTIVDNNTLQEISLGTYVRITLEENPSTGYKWQYTIPQDAMELISDDFIPPEDPIPGAPGLRVITLKTIAIKEFSFSMEYVRPGENIPISQFLIDFSVIDL